MATKRKCDIEMQRNLIGDEVYKKKTPIVFILFYVLVGCSRHNSARNPRHQVSLSAVKNGFA